MSWSVRYLVVSLVSRFRRLDQEAVDVLAAACRDEAAAPAATVERCRSFGASKDLDLGSVIALLQSDSPRSVLVGATLLQHLAGRDPDRIAVAVAALAGRAGGDDPLLDCFTVGRETLRETLVANLARLVWSPSVESGDSPPTPPRPPGGFAASELDRPAGGIRLDALPFTEVIAHIAELPWIGFGSGGTMPGLAWSEILGEAPQPATAELYAVAVNQVLSTRTGLAMFSELSSLQATEIDLLTRHGEFPTEGGAWLARHVPGSAERVREIADALADELREVREEVIAALEDVLADLDLDAAIEDGALAARAVLSRGTPNPLDLSGGMAPRDSAFNAARRIARLGRPDAAEALFTQLLMERDPADADVSPHDCEASSRSSPSPLTTGRAPRRISRPPSRRPSASPTSPWTASPRSSTGSCRHLRASTLRSHAHAWTRSSTRDVAHTPRQTRSGRSRSTGGSC